MAVRVDDRDRQGGLAAPGYRHRPTVAALIRAILFLFPFIQLLATEAREEASHVSVDRAATATRSVATATTAAATRVGSATPTADLHVVVVGVLAWGWLGFSGGG